MHSVKSELFSIKIWRKLTKFYPMTIIFQTMKMKYNFSEIIYHVLGYWKWFTEINDSTPLYNCIALLCTNRIEQMIWGSEWAYINILIWSQNVLKKCVVFLLSCKFILVTYMYVLYTYVSRPFTKCIFVLFNRTVNFHSGSVKG